MKNVTTMLDKVAEVKESNIDSIAGMYVPYICICFKGITNNFALGVFNINGAILLNKAKPNPRTIPFIREVPVDTESNEEDGIH